jgi:hypothetical protein
MEDNHRQPTVAVTHLIEGAIYLNQGHLFLLVKKQIKTPNKIGLTWINLNRNKIVGPEDWYPEALMRVELVSEP